MTLVSDGAWLATKEGPIRSSDLLDGENYDARREMPGWDKAGFKPEGWLAAETRDIASLPGSRREALTSNPQSAIRNPQSQSLLTSAATPRLSLNRTRPFASSRN